MRRDYNYQMFRVKKFKHNLHIHILAHDRERYVSVFTCDNTLMATCSSDEAPVHSSCREIGDDFTLMGSIFLSPFFWAGNCAGTDIEP